MNLKFRLPTSSKGQSLVELAFSMLILIYLLSGALEFGIAFLQSVQLRDAAQEGALYGSTNPPSGSGDFAQMTAIANRAKASSNSPIDLESDPNVSVTVAVTDGKYCEGGSLQVTITYPHKIFMPFIPALIGSSTIDLNATVSDTILTPGC